MSRTSLKLLADWLLLTAALLTFGSGVVLLLSFHVDDGPLRTSALGLTRLAWLNLHRLPALALLLGLGLHLGLNARPLLSRLRRFFRRGRRGPERALYLAFWTVVATGATAWLLVDGSAPLTGPAPLGEASHLRHGLVDVHNVSGLVALPLAVHHVGHRWRRMVGTRRRPAEG